MAGNRQGNLARGLMLDNLVMKYRSIIDIIVTSGHIGPSSTFARGGYAIAAPRGLDEATPIQYPGAAGVFP